ncbi:hypothetical protein H4Q26_007413 [Puccinia striiformis f. sp. tritici PST-130]|nr:hypothetical protein H4Q26_007413 [Puccinia striiformis f. sp. tritici PST-130]
MRYQIGVPRKRKNYPALLSISPSSLISKRKERHVKLKIFTKKSKNIASPSSGLRTSSTFEFQLPIRLFGIFVIVKIRIPDITVNSSDLLGSLTPTKRLPRFLKTEIPTSASFNSIKKDLRGLGLHTVVRRLRCPNIGQCGVAIREKQRLRSSRTYGRSYQQVGVGYIVMTSVDRDDLPDGGASHFAKTIQQVKAKAPHILLEALTPDFAGPNQRASTSCVANSGLDVFAHNMETVERLTPSVRDRRAHFHQSLDTLRWAKETGPPGLITKTSIMLGVGEEDAEVVMTLKELRKNSVDVVTFGQYMRPTKRHMKVESYITPAKFEYWKTVAEQMGFLYVASGPLVRSSFKANELLKSSLGKRLLKKE